MDIKITKPTPTDLEVLQERNEDSVDSGKVDGDNSGEIDHIAVKQVLEIDRDDSSYDEDVQRLVRWAKAQSDSDDPTELKWVIRDLRMRLGTPPIWRLH